MSNLLYTIKTHKNKGDVSLRLIHSGALHPFAAGSGVLRQELKSSLAPLGHLVRSTDELLQRLLSRKFPNDCQFAKLDIKDFYLMGDHRSIVSTVKPLFNQAYREELGDLLECILFHQYVGSAHLEDNEVWQVKTGSGIGQSHSGELSDVYFYELVERHFACRLNGRATY